jgi:hypothetical protein
MATTTNYSWTTPDDTDLVKDGASAIRTLGSAIDTTVFTNAGAAVAKATVDAKGDLLVGTADNTVDRLAVGTDGFTLVAKSSEATGLAWEAPAVSTSGLTLISTTTIGSGVSSVTVTGAFSTTYDNYRIIVSGGVSSTSNNCILKLGSTTSGYEQTEWTTTNSSNSVGVSSSSNTQGFNATKASANSHVAILDILAPFLSKYTSFYGWAQRSVSTFSTQINHGTLTDTTSYTEFTLTPDAGTLTGGTIKVYGYQNS